MTMGGNLTQIITLVLEFLFAMLVISAVLSLLVIRSTPPPGGSDEEDANIQRRLNQLREEWIMQNRGPVNTEEETFDVEDQSQSTSIIDIFNSPQFNQILGQVQTRRSLAYRVGVVTAWVIGFALIIIALALGIGLAHLFGWI